jgi:hypothetical protein
LFQITFVTGIETAVTHPLLLMGGLPLLKDTKDCVLSTKVQSRGTFLSRGKTRSYFSKRTEKKTGEGTAVNCNKINNRSDVLWLGLFLVYSSLLHYAAQTNKAEAEPRFSFMNQIFEASVSAKRLKTSCYRPSAGFLLGLLFDPEVGSKIFLRNVASFFNGAYCVPTLQETLNLHSKYQPVNVVWANNRYLL